jgi:adenylate cyclase
LKHGGYIDKFIGDAVLGVFGVPAYHKNHSRRAVRAAFDMQKTLRNTGRNNNVLLSSVGIGLDSGLVVSGNIGSPVKMEYTVIGDSVNVASHISRLAGPGDVIISKNIYQKLSKILDVEALPPQRIKGKSLPLKTYKVLKIMKHLKDPENGKIQRAT